MNVLESKIYLDDIKRELDNLNLSKFKHSNILVTGGLGLIGSSIVDLLVFANAHLKLNSNIFVADINEKGFCDRYSGIEHLHFIKYDARDSIEFDILFDYIICCAGIANPSLYIEKPVETFLTNFLGLKNLLDYSCAKSPKRLVYISSSEIYGRSEEKTPMSEESYGAIDPTNVRSSYPGSKLCCEILAKSYFAEFGVNVISVRPGHVFGPRCSQSDQRIASSFPRAASLGLPIVLKSSGRQLRSFCYSLDCAGAILHLLGFGDAGESYNIGSMAPMSILDMAQCVSSYANVNLISENPNHSESLSFNPMDNSSLCSRKLLETGFSFSFTSSEGFKHMIDILREIA